MATRKPAKSRRIEPTKELRERVCKTLSTGTFREMARKKAGISPSLWATWLRDGKAERVALDEGTIEELGPRGLFVQAIEKVEAEAHERILREGVLTAGPEAQRWYLKCRYPELYSSQPARGVMDEDTGELVKIDPRELLKEKLRDLLEGMDQGT